MYRYILLYQSTSLSDLPKSFGGDSLGSFCLIFMVITILFTEAVTSPLKLQKRFFGSLCTTKFVKLSYNLQCLDTFVEKDEESTYFKRFFFQKYSASIFFAWMVKIKRKWSVAASSLASPCLDRLVIPLTWPL